MLISIFIMWTGRAFTHEYLLVKNVNRLFIFRLANDQSIDLMGRIISGQSKENVF